MRVYREGLKALGVLQPLGSAPTGPNRYSLARATYTNKYHHPQHGGIFPCYIFLSMYTRLGCVRVQVPAQHHRSGSIFCTGCTRVATAKAEAPTCFGRHAIRKLLK
ncbi:unnamed protein product [Trichogramma brassicae]|uniref:Uncharacterized protein n=1 Tax=Trichogramma brassicae TaxID=86971 RepID=A0A6H5INM9_9HYME|nr:unnamed protein product [Trichogramma brassicae]